MFEQQDIERLQQLGYTIWQGDTILTSDGRYVPSVTVGNKTYESIYGNDLASFEADYNLEQKAKKDGFVYDESKPVDEFLQVKDFAAKKTVERYKKNPDQVPLDLNDGHIIKALEDENRETGLLYATTPEDYVNDNNATSDDPVIRELAEASNAGTINDLKSIKNRIKEIQNKDADIDTQINKNDDTEKRLAENSWYNPENISIYLEKALIGAIKLFSPDGAGMDDPKLKKEYLDLKKKQKAIEDVAISSRLAKERAKLEEVSAAYKDLQNKLGTEEWQEGDAAKLDNYSDRQWSYQRRVKELEDMLSYDSNNIFTNIVNAFLNQGIKSIDSMFAKDATHGYFKVLPAAERINSGTATEDDKQIVSDYIDQQNYNDFVSQLESPGEAHKISTGLTSSLGFIGEISLSPTKGASGTIKKQAGNIVGKKAKGLVTQAVKQGADKLGKVLPAKVGTLVNKATDFTGKVLKEGVDAAFTPLGMGSTYSKLFNNQHPIIYDDQGNLLMDEDAHRYETTKLTAQYNTSQQIINELANKQNLTNEEKETLRQAMSFTGTEGTIHGISRNKSVETYDNMVDKMQSMKGFGAFYNAYVDNAAETFSERLGALGVGKAASRLAKSNRYTRALVDNKLVDNFNKYSQAVNRYSGGHIHGVFDEILEENAVPYIKHGLTGRDKHEIYQMRNWDAQKDVAVQTVAMNLLFRAPGAIQQNLTKEGRAQKKFLKEIRQQNKVEKDRLTKLYKDIASVGSVEDLAKVVDFTAIPGQPNEHTINQITNLKAEGKTEEAKKLQDTMFHYNAISAVATGTENDFKWAMRKLQRDPNLADAQGSITEALSALETYKGYKDAYDNKSGKDIIVQNLFNRDLTQKEIGNTERDLQQRVANHKFEMDLFEKSLENKLGELTEEDYNIGSFGVMSREYNNIEAQDKFNKIAMDQAKSFSPEVQGIVNHSAQKLSTLKKSLDVINNLHIELNSPQMQRKMAAKSAVQAEVYRLFLDRQGAVTPQEVSDAVNRVYENNPDLDPKTKEEITQDAQEEVQEVTNQAQIERNTAEQANITSELEAPTDTRTDLPVENSEVNEAAEDIMNDDILNDLGPENLLSDEDLAALGALSRRRVTKPVSKAYADKIDNYIKNKIEPELDRDATFQDFIEDMIKSSTYKKVDDAYNVLADAWKKTGRELENPDAIYNKYFVSAESLLDEGITDFTSDSQEQVQEVNIQQEEEVNKLTTKRKRYNPNTNTPQVDEVVAEDGKTLSPDYKFAYNFQQLKLVDGEYRILSRDLKDIDPNDLLNNRYILDSDFTAKLQREGTPLIIRPMDLDDIPVGGGRTWGDLKAESPRDPNWFANNVPMAVVYTNPANGEPVVLSMVHTASWYNDKNISLRKGSSEQDRVINEGKKNIEQLRKQVIENGSATVTIDNISTGPFHKTDKQIDKTPLTISQATGDSTLAVLLNEGGSLFAAVNGSKKAFDKGVLSSNLNSGQFKVGEVVDIRQVGTSKEGTPIYTAFKIMVNSPTVENPVLKSNLPTWISDNLKYATLTAIVLNNKDNNELLQQINDKYNFNITKAEALNKIIGNETGLYPVSNLAEYYKLFVQVGSKDTFQDRVNKGEKGLTYFENTVPNEIKITHKNTDFYSGHMSIGAKSTDTTKTMQNLERAFGNNGIVGKSRFNIDFGYLGKSERFKISQIRDGEVVPDSAKTFDEVQKDNLRTDIVSHKIESISGEDKWITAVQPKITFNLIEEVVQPEEVTITQNIDAPVKVTTEVNPNDPVQQAMAGMSESERKLFQEMIASGHIQLDGNNQANFSRRKLEEAELANIQDISTTKVDGITNQQQKSIEDSLMNSIISSFDFTKTITNAEIKDAITDSVDTHLGPLLNNLVGVYNNIKAIPALSQSAQDYADRISVLENIINQKDKLISTKPNNLGSLVNKFNTLLGENFEQDEDITGEVDSFSQSFLEKDINLTFSGQLKLSFYGYPKTNKNGSNQVNFIGAPEFHTADDVVLKLKEITSTIPSSWNKFIERLDDAAVTRKSPLYTSIKNKVEKYPEQVKNELLYKLISKKLNVYKVINSPKYGYAKDESGKSVRIVEGYNLQVYDENSSKEDIRWKQEIRQNYPATGFGMLNQDGEVVLNRIYAQNILKRLTDAVDRNDNRYETVRNLFDSIGLDGFPDNTVKEYLEDKKDVIYSPTGLLGRFQIELKKSLKKQDPVMLAESSNIPFNNMNAIINDLVELETTLNGTFVANSIRVSGKTMQGVIANTSFYDTTQELSNPESPLLDTYLGQSYTKENFVLKYLKEDAKFRENFQNIGFSSPDAYKLHGKNNSGETSMDKIAEQDNLATTLAIYSNTRGNLELTNKKGEIPGIDGLTFRNGKMLSNTLSDKGRLLYMNTLLLNVDRDKVNFDDEGNATFDAFLSEFLVDQMFMPEFNRIIDSYKQDTNVKGYDSAAKIFLNIPSFNSIQVNGNNIHRYLSATKTGYTIPKDIETMLRQEAKKKIEAYISTETRNKIDIENKTGSFYTLGFYKKPRFKGENAIHNIDSNYIKSKNISDPEQALRLFASEFAINNMLNQNNIYQIYLGDMAFYAKDKAIPMTNKTYIDKDTGKEVTTRVIDYDKLSQPEVYGGILEGIGVIVDKRAASLIAPGLKLANANNPLSEAPQEFVHLAMEDVVGVTDAMIELIESRYEGEFTRDMKNALDQIKALKVQLDNNPELRNDIHKEIRSIAGDYFGDISDYFNIEGTDAQEYTTWKAHIDMLFRQGKLTNSQESMLRSAYDKLLRGEDVSKDELDVIMQPVKPVYTGLVPYNNVMRPVYIKSSAFPLLPQITKNLKIDSLRDKMEAIENRKGLPVRVSYQTANKIGALKSDLTMDAVYTKSLDQLEPELNSSLSILPMKNFKIQQETPSKENKYYKKNKDAQITMGSQFFKIILGNGINHMDEQVFKNIFSPTFLEETGIDSSKDMLSGKDLDKIYTKAYFDYSDTLQEDLHKELGIKSTESFYGLPLARRNKVIQNLHKILKREVDTRSYPEFLKDSLQLTTNDDGSISTIMPLMFDSNSHKFESLLQALISNRLITHTLPGNGHIAASSEGFSRKDTFDSLTANERRGIMWVNPNREKDLSPTFNKDGEVTESEVLIQSHYKVFNADGTVKYVDLSSDMYSENIVEDGMVVGRKLKLDMIDEQLLTNFSFRIPTSSHQSGVIVRVAGFLPKEMGDILIVPKEHTTQLGEDYDIDKRFVYKSNYKIAKDGKIKKLNYENLRNKLEELNSLQDKSNTSVNRMMEAIFSDFDSEDLIQELKEELNALGIDATGEDRITASQRTLNKLKIKMLENTIIDIYKSVYTSPSNEIQRKIFKPLVTDIAEETSGLMESKLVASKDLTNFSILSDDYQRYLLNLGSDGKGGIGVHSNAVTLEAQLQRLPQDERLVLQSIKYKKGPNGTYKEVAPFKDRLGGFEFTGKLGDKTKTFDGYREVAEQHGENQNVSTDNINKQIMGKRNENTHTMSIYALLAHMGYDLSKDAVNTGYGKPTQMHLPSLLMNQPVIREYVRLKNMLSGITQTFNPNADKDIVEMLSTQFQFPIKVRASGVNINDFIPEGYNIESLENMLSGQTLWDNLKDEEASPEIQMIVLQKFFTYKNYADQLTEVQGLINLSTSKLGVSYFETNQRVEVLNKIGDGSEDVPLNAKRLIGDSFSIAYDSNGLPMPYDKYMDTLDTESQEYAVAKERADLIKSGEYSLIGRYYWKPSTIEGKMLVNSLTSANSILPIFYPYNNPVVKDMIGDIFMNKGTDPNKKSSAGLKWKYEIMSEFNNFISSNNDLFTGDVNQERERLFFETADNKPLAWILKDLKTKKHPIMENSLLKDLKFEVGVEGQISLITHFNTQGNSIDADAKYNAFVELIQNDEILGEYNGEVLTVSKMAQDLATYAYLADNQNGATGFRNYVSVPYLDAVGTTGRYRKIYDAFINHGTLIADRFTKQYFQHHPERALVIDEINTDRDSMGNLLVEESFFPINKVTGNPVVPKFISIRDTSKKEGKKWKLYQDTRGDGVYEPIDVLGDAKYNEYNSREAGTQKTLLNDDSVKVGGDVVNVGGKVRVRIPGGTMLDYDKLNPVLKNKGLKDLVKFFNESTLIPNPKKEFITELLEYIDPSTKLSFGKPSRGALGMYDKETNTITLHENLLTKSIELANNNFAEGFEIAREVMLEEALHAVTIKEFDKYVAGVGPNKEVTLVDDAPIFAKKLVALYESARTNVPFDPNDISTYYSKDIYEFMAGMFVSKDYRDRLDSTGKSLIAEFKRILKDMFKLLYKDRTGEALRYDSEVFNALKDMLQVTKEPSPSVPQNSFDSRRKAMEDVKISDPVTRPLDEKTLSLQRETEDPLNCN